MYKLRISQNGEVKEFSVDAVNSRIAMCEAIGKVDPKAPVVKISVRREK